MPSPLRGLPRPPPEPHQLHPPSRVEADAFPPCPGPECATPDNGPQPTAADADIWGVEREPIRLDRLTLTLYAGETNFTDWYYPSSGLSVTQGLPSLDSSALSLDAPAGRGLHDVFMVIDGPRARALAASGAFGEIDRGPHLRPVFEAVEDAEGASRILMTQPELPRAA